LIATKASTIGRNSGQSLNKIGAASTLREVAQPLQLQLWRRQPNHRQALLLQPQQQQHQHRTLQAQKQKSLPRLRQHRRPPHHQQQMPARRQVLCTKQVGKVPHASTATMVSRIGMLGPLPRRLGAARMGRNAHSIVMQGSTHGRQLGPSPKRVGAASTQPGVAPTIVTKALKPGKLHGQLHISSGAASMREEVARLLPQQPRQPHQQRQPRQRLQQSQRRQPHQLQQYHSRPRPPRRRRQQLLQHQLQPGRLQNASLSGQRRRSSVSQWQGRASRWTA